MAKAAGLRPRTLSVIFGGYFLVAIAGAFLESARLSVYVDPGATRWICTAYVLLGATVLVGVCVGAVARWTRLDARVEELEDAQREALAPAAQAPEPSDLDVEQLLLDLKRVGEAASAEAGPGEEPEAPLIQALEATADRRGADRNEIRRLGRVRDAIGAYTAGPAIASAGLLGVFTALLPATDGMLEWNLQLNAFVGLAGVECLAGLVVYVAAAFRQLGRRAA